MVVLIGGMFVMNHFAKKSAKKRQDEQEKTLREQLVPGAWVQTYSGFFGRFVDLDGDVVILETPAGEETYWVRAAIRAVTDPPFEDVSDDATDPELSAPAITPDYDFDKAEAELRENSQDVTVEEATETVTETATPDEAADPSSTGSQEDPELGSEKK